jgi:general secretion pathway protein A
MYIEYFGLTEEPFNLTPDPKYIYLSNNHDEALARLQFGIEMRKGLMLLTGGVGSGKTTIIQTLMTTPKVNQKMALVVHPKIIGSKLLQSICREFGIDLDFRELTNTDILNLLYEYILKKSFSDENFTVIIDDAHNLTDDQLEDVLLICKIETNTRHLLQVILAGLPELNAKLKRPEMLPLFQRIQIQYHLKAFSYSDTQDYILYRLAQAGHSRQDLFKADAIQRIYQLSKGVPRTINVLASNALLYAFLKGLKRVDHEVINLSCDESLQESIETDDEGLGQIRDKFPPHLQNSPGKLKKRRKWLKTILYTLIITIAIIVLNIIAQYLIEYFQLF